MKYHREECGFNYDTKRFGYANLGFLVSGRGSNLRAIVNHCKGGRLDATPVIVISNYAAAGALRYAREMAIPAFHMNGETEGSWTKCDHTMTALLKEYRVDWVVLAGYTKKVGSQLLETFHNRVLNIHPSLLPRHGGAGMYGQHVHQSVLDAGDSETGATVHLVNEEYDQGEILAQRRIPVVRGDTPESLAARVLELEHSLYAETLQEIISGNSKPESVA